MSEVKLIPLTRGAYTIVDAENYDQLVSLGKWHLSDMGYAVRREVVNGKKTTFRMHRLIANTPTSLVTDHINRNRLDNRAGNLRAVTQQENMRNKEPGKGVWYHKKNKNWVVEINSTHVGCFGSEELAMQIAYMIYEKELPLTKIKITNHFCKYGHDKRVVGTYGNSCKKCVLQNQKNYYRRKNNGTN